jgi:hypothetical protein
MLLKGAENTEFEMKVVGYQFPHLDNEPYDSDWLNINVRVVHPRGAWSATDACLLTWEVASLAEWLRRMADDTPAHSEENFIEPELHFEWFGESQSRLRVYLDYSLRPVWSPYHGANEEEELYVEFVVNPEELRSIAGDLRSELKKFPIRVKEM